MEIKLNASLKPTRPSVALTPSCCQDGGGDKLPTASIPGMFVMRFAGGALTESTSADYDEVLITRDDPVVSNDSGEAVAPTLWQLKLSQVLLLGRFVVDEDFYLAIEDQVTEGLEHLVPGCVYDPQELCGAGYWHELSAYKQRLALLCLMHLAVRSESPIRLASGAKDVPMFRLS